jgi:hypothetical protein
MSDPVFNAFRVLLPAARVDFRPEHQAILARGMRDFSDWAELVPQAEQHGMGPLFYTHAREAGIEMPDETALQLKGLTLRHRLAAAARTQGLTEILAAADGAGLDVILLKGAAMAHLIYPEPGLRPSRDIDLLASPGQADRLQRLVLDLGFHQDEEVPWDHHHLPTLVKKINSFSVSVEVHHEAFHFSWRGKEHGGSDWLARLRPVTIQGQPALTFSLGDMLWHSYRHMMSGPIRLMAVADMLGLVEKFPTEIDWSRLERDYPGLLNVLALLHDHSPLSPEVVQAAGIDRRNGHIPFGDDLRGWSNIPSSHIRVIGLPKFLQLTFTPSDWWLYLYYGADQRQPIWPYRYISYPLDRARLIWQRLARQLSSVHHRPVNSA